MAEDDGRAERLRDGDDAREPTRRMNRLAVWSFSLSFLGFFFPALALSVILGLMGRKEVECSPDRLRGRGLATAGIAISMTWFVLLLSLFFYHNILPLIVAGHRERLDERCQANLTAVATAIESYRAGNENTFPPDLQTLADGGYIPAERLECPAAPGPFDPDRVDATGGYAYRPFTPPEDPGAPLVWDGRARHGKPGSPRANILHLDGRVESVPAFELKELLQGDE